MLKSSRFDAFVFEEDDDRVEKRRLRIDKEPQSLEIIWRDGKLGILLMTQLSMKGAGAERRCRAVADDSCNHSQS